MLVIICQTLTTAAGDLEGMLADIVANPLPLEKVYLHFDNTSYRYGDKMWFSAYLVNADGYTSPPLSNTLYVELLTPGGEVVKTKVIKLVDGRGHGEFSIDMLPFYSGFYEVRAYTKFMLNFGGSTVFSRVIPVFDKPAENTHKWREMKQYGTGLYKYVRKQPKKGKAVNVKFYPEGGYLVKDLYSHVAFEATDRLGHPIDIKGLIVDGNDSVLTNFETIHGGRGCFDLYPKGKAKAIVDYQGKSYKFDLPDVRPNGYALSVDNLNNPDSISVEVRRSNDLEGIDTLGIVILSGGAIKNYTVVRSSFNRPLFMRFDAAVLTPGVATIMLVDSKGNTIADRLIFRYGNDDMNIRYAFDKSDYQPCEKVKLAIKVTDSVGSGIAMPLSIAVRDADEDIEYRRDIRTDLLLMSDIKGYVADPDYYFKSDDYSHRLALDHLLLVQGWRRYPWDKILAARKTPLRYRPETKGIETVGTVFYTNKNKGKPGVEVSALLVQGHDDDRNSNLAVELFTTDSLGRFAFTSDIIGDCYMVLTTHEKGKRKNYSIAIDRLFSPRPNPYRFTDMEITESNASQSVQVKTDTCVHESDIVPGLTFEGLDSIYTGVPVARKPIKLKEIVVKSRKNSKENDIYHSKMKSYAYYDVKSDLDDIRDDGEDIGEDIHEFLVKQNKEFYRTFTTGDEYLFYKGRVPLFVIDYETATFTREAYFKYKLLRMEAIKSIYVSEDFTTLAMYADPRIDRSKLIELFSCTVLIETYPEGHQPADAGKGVRKTRLHGYCTPQEFYSPDYSVMEPETDYRRTLYWNPALQTDESGSADVEFYNSSFCRRFTVDAQSVSHTGKFSSTLKRN